MFFTLLTFIPKKCFTCTLFVPSAVERSYLQTDICYALLIPKRTGYTNFIGGLWSYFTIVFMWWGYHIMSYLGMCLNFDTFSRASLSELLTTLSGDQLHFVSQGTASFRISVWMNYIASARCLIRMCMSTSALIMQSRISVRMGRLDRHALRVRWTTGLGSSISKESDPDYFNNGQSTCIDKVVLE